MSAAPRTVDVNVPAAIFRVLSRFLLFMADPLEWRGDAQRHPGDRDDLRVESFAGCSLERFRRPAQKALFRWVLLGRGARVVIPSRLARTTPRGWVHAPSRARV